METHVEMQKALRRLPRMAARVAEMEKVMSKHPKGD
jgi:UDP-3-O-[3-hydroxymyristoyl] glucosamine N-acyltransferase